MGHLLNMGIPEGHESSFWLNYIAQKARTSYKSMCFRVLRGLSHLEFDVKSDVLQFKNIVIPWNKTKSAIKK